MLIYGDDTATGLDHFATIRGWGYKNASVLKGGFAGWQKADLPVESGATATEIVYVPKPKPGSVSIEMFANAADNTTAGDVVILDEPTSALDPASRRHVRGTIAKLRRELGLTVIWVTHYMEEVMEVADRVYLLLDGRIADEGTPQELLGPLSEHITAEFAAGLIE